MVSIKRSLALAAGICILILLMTVATAMASEDTSFTPGVVPTVRGTIEVTAPNEAARANPSRPIREITYMMGARQSYRRGDWSYYTRKKQMQETLRPTTQTWVTGTITGKKMSAFVKTAPDLHPYVAASGLRQTIKTLPAKKTDPRLSTNWKIPSYTTEQGGE